MSGAWGDERNLVNATCGKLEAALGLQPPLRVVNIGGYWIKGEDLRAPGRFLGRTGAEALKAAKDLREDLSGTNIVPMPTRPTLRLIQGGRNHRGSDHG